MRNIFIKNKMNLYGFILFFSIFSCTEGNQNQITNEYEIETLENVYFSMLKINENLHVEIFLSIQNNGTQIEYSDFLELLDSIKSKRKKASSPYRIGLDPDKFIFSEDLDEVTIYISYLTQLSNEMELSEQLDSMLSRALFYLERTENEPTYRDHLLMSLDLMQAELIILQNIKMSVRA